MGGCCDGHVTPAPTVEVTPEELWVIPARPQREIVFIGIQIIHNAPEVRHSIAHMAINVEARGWLHGLFNEMERYHTIASELAVSGFLRTRRWGAGYVESNSVSFLISVTKPYVADNIYGDDTTRGLVYDLMNAVRSYQSHVGSFDNVLRFLTSLGIRFED